MPPLLQNSIILYPYKICRKTLDLKQNLMRFCNKKTTSSKRKCGFQKKKNLFMKKVYFFITFSVR